MSNYAQIIRGLKNGLGVEDFAVKEGVKEGDVRRIISFLREKGLLANLIRPPMKGPPSGKAAGR